MRDRLLILAAAFLFSTGGAAIKACALSSWQVASFRSGFAVLTMLLLVPAARRGWTMRTWLVGSSYAATMILYALANKLTTAANTIFLQGTAPLYVLLLSPWLLGESFKRRDVIYMLVLAVGITFFFTGEQQPFVTAPEPMLGNILGAGIGLTWALTIMGLRWLGREGESGPGSSAAAVTCGNLIACLAALPFALPVLSAGPADWLAVVYLGVFQIGVAYVFLTRGLSRVGALEGSLLLLVEPVFNPLWAWIFHGETPSTWALAGGLLILGATAMRAFSSRAAATPR